MEDTAAATVRVGVAQPVAAQAAPVPRNAAERVVFPQLYETLVAVDCAGRVQPGLAASWTAQEQGRVWHVRLRPDAQFSDGVPVSAGDVAASWTRNAKLAPTAHAMLTSVTSAGTDQLRIELRTPLSSAALFALPAFAVARATPGSAWPVGTTSFHVDSEDAARRILRLAAHTGAMRTLEFHTITSADPRRALDAGVDVLVTTDVPTVEYARALPGYSVTPLRYSRTYALITSGAAATEHAPPPNDELRALAQDVVRGDARAADSAAVCVRQPDTRTTSAATRAIFYPREDAIARSLAERLVALAQPGGRTSPWLRSLLFGDAAATRALSTLGLEPRALADSLRRSAAHAYVVALPRTETSSCDVLALSDDVILVALGAAAFRITPLVDVREQLIRRPGFGTVIVDGDGTIRFTTRSP